MRWLLGVLLAAWAWGQSGLATVTVQTAQPGTPVSPLLYGVFFEEINRAGDGGLYAELLRNRSFADAPEPVGWATVAAGGRVRRALDLTQPLNPQQPTSLRVELVNVTGGRAGVANDGFGGLPLRAGQSYRLHLALRAAPVPVGLTVALENRFGRVLASRRLDGVSAAWAEQAITLVPHVDDSAGRLVISATGPGTFWLAATSLLPPTWRGRANGLRPDLAAMLDGLHPGFVRFPGGCFVEGNRLANACRWKDTIGPLPRRPGHWNLWGYRSTDGLGYHEYLQLCEDLGAAPLFVVNCGMAHEDHAPPEQMATWVQDALDAVEYANGPVDSRWGRQRAAAGHPQPFGLKYVEIGNENSGPVYEVHYALFHDALKARYPALQLVANAPVKSRPMDLLDEHYYSSAEFFLSQAHRYDTYRRDGPRIYVGEYAVTQAAGQGNLRAALGEAGFMCGLERNSDVVVMASYAPLFVRADTRQWNPDLIVFDQTRVCGTPSYYVQQLFSLNRPEVSLPTAATATPTAAAPLRGGVGLGTWNTQAEFKDLTVTRGDQTLLRADFHDLQGWHKLRGEWPVADGAVRQTSSATDARMAIGDAAWTDCTLHLKARKLGGAEGFLISFAVQGEGDWAWWNLGGWGNARHNVEWSRGGSKSEVDQSVPGRIETGRWYDIRIETKGRTARCYLDDKLISTVDFAAPDPLHVTAGRAANGDLLVKAINAHDQPLTATIDLHGWARHGGGSATVLTADDPAAENSLDEPRKVVPETSPVAPGPGKFQRELPAWSLTILRLKAP